jgi:hypothetical protein
MQTSFNQKFAGVFEMGIECLSFYGPSKYLCKLGFKKEAAGKLRIFAMVDPITQWVLGPLHEKTFKILSAIPQDGTFDQIKPVLRLIERKPNGPYYSFDLSSATDRLPVVLAEHL